jgi:hypothetical protein
VSSDNAQVVRCVIDAWNRRDLSAALELTHPQCENRSVQATETAYGREGVAATFRDWFDTSTIFKSSLRTSSSLAIAFSSQHGSGRGRGERRAN